MKRLIFYSLERFDEIWRRNQFICRGLWQANPDLQILWVNPAVDLLAAGTALGIMPQCRPHPDYPAINCVQPIKLLPNVIGESVNNSFIRHHINTCLDQLGWRDGYHIWINNHHMRNCLPPGKPVQMIYDITDDWASASQSARARARVIRDDLWLLKHADQVIVCSQYLFNMKASAQGRLTLVSNGVDVERFSPQSLQSVPVAEELSKLASPIIGYTGSLHADRLDIELILQVAKRLPEAQFVFVGPDFLSATSRKQLLDLPNCKILGARDYRTLPSYMKAFDLLWVPHLVSPFTDSLDPLKLYEYMSSGKPIVATACGGFRNFATLITLASEAREFAEAIRQNLSSQNPEAIAARLKWAKDQSWERRLEAIQTLMI